MRRLFFLFLIVGCEKSEPTIADADVGDFFSESVFEESASASEEDVPCVGTRAKLALDDRRALRGTVVAPPKTTARFSFFSEAHAVPVDGEIPRPNVEVTFGNDVKTWETTTTDPLGRFCFYAGRQLTSTTVLTATVDGEKLRRLVPTTHIAVVSMQTEAVTQIATNYQPLTIGEVINLQTMADTRTDLHYQSGMDGGISSAIARIRSDLESDPRLQKWMKRRTTARN